jgi:hypothetical protein
MLASTVGGTPATFAREVIVAIVGGTMLTLALTRPRLRWVEQLTRDSERTRVWAERALTGFSFVMAGYAGFTLLGTLYKQLGAEFDALLRGAACFLFVYAWLVHFEPFVREWRLRGGVGAAVLYTGLLIAAMEIGGVIAEMTLGVSVIPDRIPFLLVTVVPIPVLGWLFYRWQEWPTKSIAETFNELLASRLDRDKLSASDDETS